MNDFESSTFARQLAALYQRVNYERQSTAGPRSFKLQTMLEFLRRLGDPQLAAPVIHVAGTKGKGSVSKMISEILSHAGFKTGTYSSPHLERINQRISINGDTISDEQFSSLIEQVQPQVDSLDAELADRGECGLTFFELLTTFGFQHFANEAVDVVVLEVGLGGRLDSTNVCQPDVCVITNIGLDHTKQLGETIGEIAGEKAGIIKQGIPVVSGALHPEAFGVIQAIAADREATLFQLDREMRVSRTGDDRFAYQWLGDSNQRQIEDLSCGMPGDHQLANAALAITACKLFSAGNTTDGKTITSDHIRRGIASAALPGRTEVLSRIPFLMIDMAHNGDSIGALVKTFQNQSASAARKRFLLATTRGKKTAEIVDPLVELADELILTRYQENPRGESIEELHAVVEQAIQRRRELGLAVPTVVLHDTPENAWQYLVDTIEPKDATCITGSAFLVAELRPVVKQWLEKRTEDRGVGN